MTKHQLLNHLDDTSEPPAAVRSEGLRSACGEWLWLLLSVLLIGLAFWSSWF